MRALTVLLLGLVGCHTVSPRSPSFAWAIERTVRAPAARADVHYVGVGDRAAPGTPLVLLHPWGADHDIWTDVTPALAAGRRAILVDLLAHGASGAPPGRYPPRRMAQAVLAAMDDAGVSRAVLVGNSLGAATALAVTELAPERVAGLVLVGAPGAIRLPAPLRSALHRAIDPSALASVSPELLAAMWRALSTVRTDAGDRVIERVLARREERSWALVAAGESSALEEVIDYAPKLEAIAAPTLVVQGADDRVVWPRFGRALAERMPHAELVWLEDCGHFPQLECPERFVPAVRAFLAKIP